MIGYYITAWKVSKYGVFSGPNTGRYGPGKTPYLDTVHAVHDEKNVVVNYRYIKEHTKDINFDMAYPFICSIDELYWLFEVFQKVQSIS